MSTRAPLTEFPNNLIADERLFSQREREIVSALLRHASQDAVSSAETKNAMVLAIERAVGETVAQRAYGLLGSNIVNQLMRESSATDGPSLSALTVPDVRDGFQEARLRVSTTTPPPTPPQPPNFDATQIQVSTMSAPPKQPQPLHFEDAQGSVAATPHHPPGPQPPGFEESRSRVVTFAAPPKQPQPPGFEEPEGRVAVGPHHPPGPQPPGFEEPRVRIAAVPPPKEPQPPNFDERSARTSPVTHPPKEPDPPGFGEMEIDLPRTSVAVLEVARPAFRPAQCLVLDEFLVPAELEALMGYALAKENEFKLSEVVAPGQKGVVDFDHRRSRVLVDTAEHENIIVDRIKYSLPRILDKLNLEPFEISRVEAQMTASGDGDFFHQHTDSGEGKVATRELTFVYFFHREPKAFTGGELRIYDSVLKDGYYHAGEKYRSIQPAQNQIVLFPSCLVHEITPIVIPSRAFADSRFTVNGWFRR